MTQELDETVTKKALKALIAYLKKSTEDSQTLIEGYGPMITVQIHTFKNVVSNIIKPVPVVIPHSLFLPSQHNVCFFCKTDDKDILEQHLKQNPIEGVTQIISLSQVRRNYATYKEKRELLSTFSHFLCDDRIMAHLYNVLGKTFGSKNRYPVPVKLINTNKLEKSIRHALDCTYIYLKGNNIALRVGNLEMSEDKIFKNIIMGLKNALEKIPGGWKAVHSLSLNSRNSASLPIYSKTPTEVVNFIKQSSLAVETVADYHDTHEQQIKPQASSKLLKPIAVKSKIQKSDKENKKKKKNVKSA